MRPLSPQDKQRILELHPAAAPGEIEADIAEYERLVALMFQRDPDASTPSGAPFDAFTVDSRTNRLTELHEKLFNR
jgi:hypothetical protein